MAKMSQLARRLATYFLNFAIAFYVLALAMLIYTGGFSYEILGMELSSERISKIIQVLIPLIVLRLLISMRLPDALLSCGSIVASLLLMEVLLRIVDPPISASDLQVVHEASPAFDWALKPMSRGTGGLGETLEINSLGMRDVEYPPKAAGEMRIATIGDSFTFGMGVELQDSYVKQLESRLRDENPAVAVMNFGVIAYHFWQYLAVLEQKAITHSPDLILVGFYLDDIHGSAEPVNRNPDGRSRFNVGSKERYKGSKVINTYRNIIGVLDTRARQQRSQLLRSLEERREVIGPTGNEGQPHPSFLVATGQISPHMRRDFEAAMQTLARLVEEHDVPLLTFYIPDSTQLHDLSRQGINGIFRDVTKKYSVPFMDLTPALEQAPDPSALFLFPDDGHTNKLGNAIIARELANHPVLKALVGVES